MTPARWRQIESLFECAAKLEPADRAAFLASACANDQDLYREVESLLASDERAQDFLEAPAAEMAGPFPAIAPDQAPEQVDRGEQIGPYRIVARLGAGGMGVVYSATDTRLGRTVAIKFLARQVAQDAQALKRFQREARAASALNHANICAVHDIGDRDGQPFLVMELLEGRSLKERLRDGPLPAGELIALGIQLSGALGAAHSKGIVHRDIKPANIFVTSCGEAKVLDFGVAKLLSEPLHSQDAEPRPAVTGPADATLSRTGWTPGTVAYMSPEQARGEPADPRADLFSLGVTLYEMATGARPFHGETPALVLESVLARQPVRPRELNPAVSAKLERIILKSLNKDRGSRYQSASELRADLERLRSSRHPLAPRSLAAAAALLLAIALIGMGIRAGRVAAPKPAAAPALKRLTSDSGLSTDPALSPDGTLLAYASDRGGEDNLDIYVRHVSGGEPIRLTRDPADEHEPALSPDRATVAFRSERAGGGVYAVSVSGGPVTKIVSEGRGPQFSQDGKWIAYWVGEPGTTLLSRRTSKVYVIPSAGGTPREIAADFAGAAYPAWSSSGKHLLFLGNRDEKLPTAESVDWWVVPLDSGLPIRTGALREVRRAGLGGSLQAYPWAIIKPAWAGGDSWIFSARSGDSTNLWQIRISEKTWTASGPPRRLTSGPASEGTPSVAKTSTGAVRAAFAVLNENVDIWSLPCDTNRGRVQGEPTQLTQDAAIDGYPSLSKDGSKLLFISERSGHQEVWFLDLQTGASSALTSIPSNKYWALFSPDSSRITFSSREDGKWPIHMMPANGGPAETICGDCGVLTAWSSDGKWGLYNTAPGGVHLMDMSSKHHIELINHPAGRVHGAHLSPDDRWVAFLNTVAGSWRMYVAPFKGNRPIPESEWIALTDGTSFVDKLRWSPDGRLIYHVADRDSYRCLWAQRLDEATRPAAAPFAVFHSHRARHSFLNMDRGQLQISVGPDKIVFSMGQRTGNVWIAEWPFYSR